MRTRYPAIGWLLIPKAGKGRALKEGLQLARGELVAFVDADGQIPPDQFMKLFEHIELHEKIDGVIGSKYQTQHSSLPWTRRLAGQAFNQLIKWLLGLSFTDTQCGVKVFRRRALRGVVPLLRQTGWTFDVELLLLLQRNGCRIKEIPITVKPESRRSRISFLRTAPAMFWGVVRMRLRSELR